MMKWTLLLILSLSFSASGQNCVVKIEYDYIDDPNFTFYNYSTQRMQNSKDYLLDKVEDLGHRVTFDRLKDYDFKVVEFNARNISNIFFESVNLGIKVLDSRGNETSRDTILWCVKFSRQDCRAGYSKLKDLRRRVDSIKNMLENLKC